MGANIEEIWKDIVGFDKYQISSIGRVRNRLTKATIKPVQWKKGWYFRVKLYNSNSKRCYFSVHRLVAIHFNENPKNYPLVLHLDNNPINNIYTNLSWGTFSDNNSQTVRDGRTRINPNRRILKGQENGNSVFRNIHIPVIREAIQQGHSLTRIARYFKTTKGTIWKIKAGYTWRSLSA